MREMRETAESYDLEESRKGEQLPYGNYGIRIEIGDGKKKVWAVCGCGQETLLGTPRVKSNRQ
jgi:hypothetical protein